MTDKTKPAPAASPAPTPAGQRITVTYPPPTTIADTATGRAFIVEHAPIVTASPATTPGDLGDLLDRYERAAMRYADRASEASHAALLDLRLAVVARFRGPQCGVARVNAEGVAYACRLTANHDGDHHPNPCGHDGCTGLECLRAAADKPAASADLALGALLDAWLGAELWTETLRLEDPEHDGIEEAQAKATAARAAVEAHVREARERAEREKQAAYDKVTRLEQYVAGVERERDEACAEREALATALRAARTLAYEWQTCDAIEGEDGEITQGLAVAKTLRHCADGVMDAIHPVRAALAPSSPGLAPWYEAGGSVVMLPAEEVERRRKAAAVVIGSARAVVTDHAQDAIEDPINHADRAFLGRALISKSAIDDLSEALDALAAAASPVGAPDPETKP